MRPVSRTNVLQISVFILLIAVLFTNVSLQLQRGQLRRVIKELDDAKSHQRQTDVRLNRLQHDQAVLGDSLGYLQAAASRGAARSVLVPVQALTVAGTDDFARLRGCESGGNYRINTGNGFYGAYQFELATWESNGGRGRPDLASPAEQDRIARILQASRGWQPWPACRVKLGLP